METLYSYAHTMHTVKIVCTRYVSDLASKEKCVQPQWAIDKHLAMGAVLAEEIQSLSVSGNREGAAAALKALGVWLRRWRSFDCNLLPPELPRREGESIDQWLDRCNDDGGFSARQLSPKEAVREGLAPAEEEAPATASCDTSRSDAPGPFGAAAADDILSAHARLFG